MQAIQESLNANMLEEVHNRFRRVGERWNELVHWQTLVGWGAFLGGIGIILWGIGSISHHQALVRREVQDLGLVASERPRRRWWRGARS
jgi:hypothetical protein